MANSFFDDDDDEEGGGGRQGNIKMSFVVFWVTITPKWTVSITLALVDALKEACAAIDIWGSIGDASDIEQGSARFWRPLCAYKRKAHGVGRLDAGSGRA